MPPGTHGQDGRATVKKPAPAIPGALTATAHQQKTATAKETSSPGSAGGFNGNGTSTRNGNGKRNFIPRSAGGFNGKRRHGNGNGGTLTCLRCRGDILSL